MRNLAADMWQGAILLTEVMLGVLALFIGIPLFGAVVCGFAAAMLWGWFHAFRFVYIMFGVLIA